MAVNPVSDNNLFRFPVTDSVSIRDDAKGCLISRRLANLSESYLTTFEVSLALFATYAEDHGWLLIADVTADRIEGYLAYVRSRPRWFGQPGRPKKGKDYQSQRPPSGSYVASLYTRIKTFFNWLVEHGHVTDNPFRLLPKSKVEDRVIPTVSGSQVQDLFRLLDPANATTKSEWFRALRDRALLFILWDTPGRRKELATLTDDSVDLASGVILVMGKGRKERWMPIGVAVQEALWTYLQAKDQLNFKDKALWLSDEGKPMLPTWISEMLKRRGKRAGILDLHPHRFHHTFAMTAPEGEMPEALLRLYGDWKKISDNYFRTLGAKHITEYHQDFSPADRLGNQGQMKRERRPGRSRL